jgi:predicted RNase H-like nuclease
MTGVGVDWASGRWVVVQYGDEVSIQTAPSMLTVWADHSDADQILVDIPIGLPSEETPTGDLEDGRRQCDAAASDRLGPGRQSSVFGVPCREAVEADSYDEAAEENNAILGRGLSSQSWGIIPRIRETDVFLRTHPEAQDTVRESHPEVCYSALSSTTDIEASKTADSGTDERVALLGEYDERFVEAYKAARERAETETWKRRVSSSRLDDVLDAMVLALTAAGETESIPSDPPDDAEGLPMEMVVPNR